MASIGLDMSLGRVTTVCDVELSIATSQWTMTKILDIARFVDGILRESVHITQMALS